MFVSNVRIERIRIAVNGAAFRDVIAGGSRAT
jgi:hypothetical protein